MANTKCGKCDKKITSKQKFNFCKGDCKLAFHLDCAEYQDDNTIEIIDILKSMQKEILALRGDVSSLKDENLKLTKLIRINNPVTISSKITSTASPNSTPPINLADRIKDNSNNQKASMITSESDLNRPQTIIHRKITKKPIIMGKGKDIKTSIQPATKRIPRKAIFVTRLDPNTSIENIEKHIKSNIGIASTVCSKIKTKYETYSSFHISTEEPDMDKILDPNVWPEGVLITEFYGQLKEDQKYVSLTASPTISKNEIANKGPLQK